jgi:metal-responsive CopG/Arc/MetJ family transcriptional regulator
MTHEHKRGMITEEISKHISDNGKLSAVVVKTEKGYMVELYEKSRYVRTVDVSKHSVHYAEDTAENYVLGYPV